MPATNATAKTRTPETKDAPSHNRIEKHLPAAGKAAELAGKNGVAQQHAKEQEELTGVAAPETLAQRAASILRKREAARTIKLHDVLPEDFVPGKLSQAVVLTGDKTPDMRFGENQNKFKADKSKRADGKTPDRRFLENREDILAISLSRANSKAGVVFEDDTDEVGDEE